MKCKRFSAQEEVKKLEEDYQGEIEASIKEYQTKLQTYSAEAESQTDVTNQARQQESWYGTKHSTI